MAIKDFLRSGGATGMAYQSVFGSDLFGDITGKNAAEAAGRAAQEQAAVAREGLQYQKESRNLAMRYAEPTLEELNSISRLLQTREQAMNFQLKNIENQLTLLNSVDPALREAGNQAYQLLQGQEAKVLAPIRKQRELQRQQLKNTLSERLGPGYETSSAGIEALTRFDDDTANTLLNAQQQTLGSLLGVSAQVRPDMTREIGSFSEMVGGIDKSLLAAQQNISGRKVSAISQTPVSFADVVGTAGSDYKADLFKAQGRQQFLNQGIGLASTLGAAYLGGPAAAGVVGGNISNSGQQQQQQQQYQLYQPSSTQKAYPGYYS